MDGVRTLYKVHYVRFGVREVQKFDNKPEAYRAANFITDYGEGMVDCITDEHDIIIYDGLRNVIGVKSTNRKGEKYECSN